MKWRTILRSSCTPFSLAAICALRSLTFCSGLRAGYLPPVNSAVSLLLAEAAAIDQLEIVDIDAFLLDRGRVRRHRARRNAADIGVVAARGDPEQNFPPVEHRRADGDVGQMRAAVIGRVDGIDVAGPDVALVLADDGLDRAIHRAEMHRHVRRVGDQRAVAVEHRAGEIEPLLDVDRIGGVLQRHAHLLGDRHEQIVEHFEHDRIGVGADGARPRELRDPPQHQMILRRQLGPPALLDHDGLMRLDDDGRPFDLVARRRASRACRRARGAICRRRKTACAAPAPAALSALVFRAFSLKCAPPPTASTDTASTTSDLLAVDEAELRLVRALEGGFHFLQRDGNFTSAVPSAREGESVPASTISGVSVPA